MKQRAYSALLYFWLLLSLHQKDMRTYILELGI